MADQVLSYAVTGKDDGASAAFKDVGAAIERVDKKSTDLAGKLVRLSEKYDDLARNGGQAAEKQEFLATGFAKLSDVTKIAIGNMMAMTGMKLVDTITSLAAGAYEAVNRFQDLSDALGDSTDTIQLYSAWAEQSGTSVESMSKAIAKLETGIAKGDKDLKKFGITALDGKEAFLQVVEAMEKAPTQIEKVRIAEAAFGKSWQDIMPVLKQGKENLQGIAENTALIDADAIKAITEMDDKLASMKTNATALAAELLAAFGPTMSDLIAGMAAEAQHLNNILNRESEADFYKRIGASKSGQGSGGRGTNIVVDTSRVDFENLSSGDLMRLMDERKAQNNSSVKWGDTGDLSLEQRYAAAIRREREERHQAEKKKQQELKAAQDRLDAANVEKTKEKDRTPDYEALSRDARAEAGLKWLAKNGNSSPDTDQQVWFDRKTIHGDTTYGGAPAWMKGFNTEKARAANEMARAGLIDYDTGVGVVDATNMSVEQMKEVLDQAKTKTEELKDASVAAAEEIKQAFSDIAHSGISQLSADLAHLTVQGKLTASSISEAFINTVENSIERVIQKFIEMQLEMALIAAFTGGTSGGAGFLASTFAHADGTLSSRGGIGTLSERGIERVITPQGSDAYVTPGIYAMSPGSRVIPAEKATPQQSMSFVIHQYGGDPAQNAEQIRRIAREESARANASNARTRYSGG